MRKRSLEKKNGNKNKRKNSIWKINNFNLNTNKRMEINNKKRKKDLTILMKEN